MSLMSTPEAKAVLKYTTSSDPVTIVDCGEFFILSVLSDDNYIKSQRAKSARQFKTIETAYSFCRTFLDWQGVIIVRTATGDDAKTEGSK